ncbi:MAG: hypothetical protein ACOCZ5_01790 [bacterium]
MAEGIENEVDIQECKRVERRYYKNYELIDQPEIPICDNPDDCEIGIDIHNIEHVSEYGGSDGEIIAIATNTTGGTNIVWYLNTANVGVGDNITISNLEAGFYDLKVNENGCEAVIRDIYIKDGKFKPSELEIKEAADLTATENPINFNLKTKRLGDGRKTVCEIAIISGSTVDDGDYVKFELESPFKYTKYFYASDFPDQDNYFLSSVLRDENGNELIDNTSKDIMQSLFDALQTDLLLNKLYHITYSSDYVIRLTAKETGEKYTLNKNNVTTNTTAINVYDIQSGKNKYEGQILDDFSIYAELYINDEDYIQFASEGDKYDYFRVAELMLPFNSRNNNHQFDFSPLLKNYVNTSRPNVKSTGYTIQNNFVKPYFIKYGVYYPVVQHTNTKKKTFIDETDIKWCINSSLDYYNNNDMEELGYLGNEGMTGITSKLTDVKFLTNSPNPKLIQRDSQEYLYFILPENYEFDLDVRGDLEFYDGSKLNDIEFFQIQEATGNTAGGVLALNISYNKLNLEDYEQSGSTVRKIKRADFAVYQTSGDTTERYTELKSFKFEIADRPRKYGIIFQNQLGGFDSIDFVGIVEETIDRESGNFTNPINFAQDGSARQGFKKNTVYDTKITNKITANTSWINLEHFNWLKELMKSNEIYSYTTENQNYLILDSFKYKKSSLDDLYEVECTFIETTFENNVSV